MKDFSGRCVGATLWTAVEGTWEVEIHFEDEDLSASDLRKRIALLCSPNEAPAVFDVAKGLLGRRGVVSGAQVDIPGFLKSDGTNVFVSER